MMDRFTVNRLSVALLFAVMAVLAFSAAAFADPHIKIEITSLYAGGNQMSVTMDIINDGDTDCRVTKINMKNIEIWDNTGSMNSYFTINDMNVLVEAQDFVTKTYNIPLPNYVPHEFIDPGFKTNYSVEWKVERSSDDDDEDSYDGGEDDAF